MKWFTDTIKAYRDRGFQIEILFVFADEKTMERRAQSRAKDTGRFTSLNRVGLHS